MLARESRPRLSRARAALARVACVALLLALAARARRAAPAPRVERARDDDDDSVIRDVTMTIGAHGDVRLRLRPDWHAESAAYVAALAADARACEDACEVYRVEPGFLVQGTLKSASAASNTKTKEGPRLMRRGDVGWAGEGPGPDFFVYVGAKPAAHFGRRHTVFAEVADETSMATLERVANAPSSTPGGTGTMRFIDERPRITLRDARSKGAARA
jgi:cyclophilin family peptidyl-prolyl cis-trans isomerase